MFTQPIERESLDVSLTCNEDHRSTIASLHSIVDGLEISLSSHEILEDSITNYDLGGDE